MAHITERFTPPTKLDFAEHGTIYKVTTDASVDLYIQASKDEEKPLWLSEGRFLKEAFSGWITNKEFLQTALDAYEKKENYSYRSFARLIDIIQAK